MKKIFLSIILLMIIIGAGGCGRSKSAILISKLDLIRVKIINIEEGRYYTEGEIFNPSGLDEKTTDYMIMNVVVTESYRDLVDQKNRNLYPKDTAFKMGIPAAEKDMFLIYDEFLITSWSKDICDYEKEKESNKVTVDLFIYYVIKNDVPLLWSIVPIKDNIIDFSNEKFDFSYIIQYNNFIKDDFKKLADKITVDEFKEWFTKVYNQQMKPKKKCFLIK